MQGELGAACRPLASSQVGAIVQTGFGGRTLWGFERWHAVWVLLAMYGFWAACLVALLTWHLVMRRSQKMHPALEPPEVGLPALLTADRSYERDRPGPGLLWLVQPCC